MITEIQPLGQGSSRRFMSCWERAVQSALEAYRADNGEPPQDKQKHLLRYICAMAVDVIAHTCCSLQPGRWSSESLVERRLSDTAGPRKAAGREECTAAYAYTAFSSLIVCCKDARAQRRWPCQRALGRMLRERFGACCFSSHTATRASHAPPHTLEMLQFYNIYL